MPAKQPDPKFWNLRIRFWTRISTGVAKKARDNKIAPTYQQPKAITLMERYMREFFVIF